MYTHKLLLFDIDGTIMYHTGPRKWEEQYLEGLSKAYGLTDYIDISKYNGKVERALAWEIAKSKGITRADFESRFDGYIGVMHDHLVRHSKQGRLFEAIPDAVSLIKKLDKDNRYVLAILTGNAQRIARWKLEHTGLDKYFAFGLYGDEADDRSALARLVFERAQTLTHMKFAPGDIYVIGDTVHDIVCGQAIGAHTIGVTTGMHGFWDALAAAKPDLLVNSLIDKDVLQEFGLGNTR